MKNKKLVYSVPSIKVSLVEEDILTMSEVETNAGFPDWNNPDGDNGNS